MAYQSPLGSIAGSTDSTYGSVFMYGQQQAAMNQAYITNVTFTAGGALQAAIAEATKPETEKDWLRARVKEIEWRP